MNKVDLPPNYPNFLNVPRDVINHHFAYMVSHAHDIARVLNLRLIKVLSYNNGNYEEKFVKLQDKSTQKYWFLFPLSLLLQSDGNPEFIHEMRNELKMSPMDNIAFHNITKLHFNSEGKQRYRFSKHPFFLTSHFGDIVLGISPVVTRTGTSTYKIKIIRLFVNPPSKCIAKYGESTKENFMQMVRFSQRQIPRPEWKIQCEANPIFHKQLLDNALKPGSKRPNKMTVGPYNEIVKYPDSAYELLEKCYKLSNTEKAKLIDEKGNGPRTVLTRLTGMGVKTHSVKDLRSKLVKKNNAVLTSIRSNRNLDMIMTGQGQASNKKKRSGYLKSYTHGNLLRVHGIKPFSKTRRGEKSHGLIKHKLDTLYVPPRGNNEGGRSKLHLPPKKRLEKKNKGGLMYRREAKKMSKLISSELGKNSCNKNSGKSNSSPSKKKAKIS